MANTTKYDSFVLRGSTEIERQKYLLERYAYGTFDDWNAWTEEAVAAKLDPSFLMCIGLAETGLGRNLKTPFNVGNIGNTDSGDTQAFLSARDGIYWMAKTLNNKYLGEYQRVSDLSRWGNKSGSIYASSPRNWHENVIRCLSALKGRFVEDGYLFRITSENEDASMVEGSSPNVSEAAPEAMDSQDGSEEDIERLLESEASEFSESDDSEEEVHESSESTQERTPNRRK